MGNAKIFDRKNKVIHRERPNYHKPWIDLSPDIRRSLEKLTYIMAQSSKGLNVLNRAQAKAHKEKMKLSDILLPGEKSYTDITLVRTFSKNSPKKIEYKSHLKVFINRNLNIQDAVMDLAHELIHYAYRETFNPYKNDFNLKNFIISTVEGKGGEVDAYMVECEVFFDLFNQYSRNKTPCHLIINSQTQKPDRNKAIKIFYRLGKHYHPFLKKIKKYNIQALFLDHVSPQHSLLISATYDLPYPIAAIHEYESILKKTCENEFKRINILPIREISSVMLEGYRKRCQTLF